MDKPLEINSITIKNQGIYGTCWAHSIARNFVRTLQILGVIKTQYKEDFYYLFYKILLENHDCYIGYDYTVMFELFNYLKENYYENIFMINWIGFKCGDSQINEELKIRKLNFDKSGEPQLADPILKKINNHASDKEQIINDFEYLFSNNLLFIGKFDYNVNPDKINKPTKAIEIMLNFRLQPYVLIFLNKYVNKMIGLSSEKYPSIKNIPFNETCIENSGHAVNLRKWNTNYIEFKNSHGIDSSNKGNFSVKDLKFITCENNYDIIFASLMFDYDNLNTEFIDRVQQKLSTYNETFESSSLENSEIEYYEGNYNKYGLFHDCGKITFANDDRYDGEFKNGIFDGYGKMIYSNGDSYEGLWKNGIFEGYGKMIYSNGDSYEGLWKNDVFEGYGKMIYSNGDIKEGEWLDNEFLDDYKKKYIKYKNKYLNLK